MFSELSDLVLSYTHRKASKRLDEWLDTYKNERLHEGKYCYGKTFKNIHSRT